MLICQLYLSVKKEYFMIAGQSHEIQIPVPIDKSAVECICAHSFPRNLGPPWRPSGGVNSLQRSSGGPQSLSCGLPVPVQQTLLALGTVGGVIACLTGSACVHHGELTGLLVLPGSL